MGLIYNCHSSYAALKGKTPYEVLRKSYLLGNLCSLRHCLSPMPRWGEGTAQQQRLPQFL